MLFSSASENRPYHWGPFPMEALPRDDGVAKREQLLPQIQTPAARDLSGSILSTASRKYRDLFAEMAAETETSSKAPLPDDPELRAMDAKGYAYFLNAAQVGICEIPYNAWVQGATKGQHRYAFVIMVEHGRVPEKDNLAHDWVAPAVGEAGDMRAAEIAVCLARHMRVYGFASKAHVAGHSELDLHRLAVLGGLVVRVGNQILNPFLQDNFSLAVVATDYQMTLDRPLSEKAMKVPSLRYWLGINGAQSGRERNRCANRPTHASRYPMEQVKRVDRPTTLINDDEIPRVPYRAAFFERALKGDLGDKAERERNRFALKHPTSAALAGPLMKMVPLQDGEPSTTADTSQYNDPVANAKAVKSLAYFMGADLVGICEIPDYAWYSHLRDGSPLTPYHKYAVVMLNDQEFDTMEGASGDDWISGVQSMRAYMRGAEISGIMADTLRELGFSSRPQTSADGHVLQLPLSLWAGLGEMSRIGELMLNPFVGPRLKSVVLTTDMPLEVDKPIDFGLQQFCSQCYKCARECPCDAIPWGDKVMFNGYEMWKPDVERCARYRLTNSRGSACGRCMKTCPLNKVVTADGPLAQRLASWVGVNAMWMKPMLIPIAVWLDDYLGHGKRNLAKKWWFDLEVVNGVSVEPVGTNKREISPDKVIDPANQKMAHYPASMMPPPNQMEPFPTDRKAALSATADLETPDQARKRRARGGATPEHYKPTPEITG